MWHSSCISFPTSWIWRIKLPELYNCQERMVSTAMLLGKQFLPSWASTWGPIPVDDMNPALWDMKQKTQLSGAWTFGPQNSEKINVWHCNAMFMEIYYASVENECSINPWFMFKLSVSLYFCCVSIDRKTLELALLSIVKHSSKWWCWDS